MKSRTKSLAGCSMMFSGVSYCAILPWLRISTRSDIVQASSGSWVTMMVVRLYWSTICLILALFATTFRGRGEGRLSVRHMGAGPFAGWVRCSAMGPDGIRP